MDENTNQPLTTPLGNERSQTPGQDNLITNMPSKAPSWDENTPLEDITKQYTDIGAGFTEIAQNAADNVGDRQVQLVGNDFGGTNPYMYNTYYEPSVTAFASEMRQQGTQAALEEGLDRGEKDAQNRLAAAKKRYSDALAAAKAREEQRKNAKAHVSETDLSKMPKGTNEREVLASEEFGKMSDKEKEDALTAARIADMQARQGDRGVTDWNIKDQRKAATSATKKKFGISDDQWKSMTQEQKDAFWGRTDVGNYWTEQYMVADFKRRGSSAGEKMVEAFNDIHSDVNTIVDAIKKNTVSSLDTHIFDTAVPITFAAAAKDYTFDNIKKSIQESNLEQGRKDEYIAAMNSLGKEQFERLWKGYDAKNLEINENGELKHAGSVMGYNGISGNNNPKYTYNGESKSVGFAVKDIYNSFAGNVENLENMSHADWVGSVTYQDNTQFMSPSDGLSKDQKTDELFTSAFGVDYSSISALNKLKEEKPDDYNYLLNQSSYILASSGAPFGVVEDENTKYFINGKWWSAKDEGSPISVGDLVFYSVDGTINSEGKYADEELQRFVDLYNDIYTGKKEATEENQKLLNEYYSKYQTTMAAAMAASARWGMQVDENIYSACLAMRDNADTSKLEIVNPSNPEEKISLSALGDWFNSFTEDEQYNGYTALVNRTRDLKGHYYIYDEKTGKTYDAASRQNGVKTIGKYGKTESSENMKMANQIAKLSDDECLALNIYLDTQMKKGKISADFFDNDEVSFGDSFANQVFNSARGTATMLGAAGTFLYGFFTGQDKVISDAGKMWDEMTTLDQFDNMSPVGNSSRTDAVLFNNYTEDVRKMQRSNLNHLVDTTFNLNYFDPNNKYDAETGEVKDSKGNVIAYSDNHFFHKDQGKAAWDVVAGLAGFVAEAAAEAGAGALLKGATTAAKGAIKATTIGQKLTRVEQAVANVLTAEASVNGIKHAIKLNQANAYMAKAQQVLGNPVMINYLVNNSSKLANVSGSAVFKEVLASSAKKEAVKATAKETAEAAATTFADDIVKAGEKASTTIDDITKQGAKTFAEGADNVADDVFKQYVEHGVTAEEKAAISEAADILSQYKGLADSLKSGLDDAADIYKEQFAFDKTLAAVANNTDDVARAAAEKLTSYFDDALKKTGFGELLGSKAASNAIKDATFNGIRRAAINTALSDATGIAASRIASLSDDSARLLYDVMQVSRGSNKLASYDLVKYASSRNIFHTGKDIADGVIDFRKAAEGVVNASEQALKAGKVLDVADALRIVAKNSTEKGQLITALRRSEFWKDRIKDFGTDILQGYYDPQLDEHFESDYTSLEEYITDPTQWLMGAAFDIGVTGVRKGFNSINLMQTNRQLDKLVKNVSLEKGVQNDSAALAKNLRKMNNLKFKADKLTNKVFDNAISFNKVHEATTNIETQINAQLDKITDHFDIVKSLDFMENNLKQAAAESNALDRFKAFTGFGKTKLAAATDVNRMLIRSDDGLKAFIYSNDALKAKAVARFADIVHSSPNIGRMTSEQFEAAFLNAWDNTISKTNFAKQFGAENMLKKNKSGGYSNTINIKDKAKAKELFFKGQELVWNAFYDELEKAYKSQLDGVVNFRSLKTELNGLRDRIVEVGYEMIDDGQAVRWNYFPTQGILWDAPDDTPTSLVGYFYGAGEHKSLASNITDPLRERDTIDMSTIVADRRAGKTEYERKLSFNEELRAKNKGEIAETKMSPYNKDGFNPIYATTAYLNAYDSKKFVARYMDPMRNGNIVIADDNILNARMSTEAMAKEGEAAKYYNNLKEGYSKSTQVKITPEKVKEAATEAKNIINGKNTTELKKTNAKISRQNTKMRKTIVESDQFKAFGKYAGSKDNAVIAGRINDNFSTLKKDIDAANKLAAKKTPGNKLADVKFSHINDEASDRVRVVLMDSKNTTNAAKAKETGVNIRTMSRNKGNGVIEFSPEEFMKHYEDVKAGKSGWNKVRTKKGKEVVAKASESPENMLTWTILHERGHDLPEAHGSSKKYTGKGGKEAAANNWAYTKFLDEKSPDYIAAHDAAVKILNDYSITPELSDVYNNPNAVQYRALVDKMASNKSVVKDLDATGGHTINIDGVDFDYDAMNKRYYGAISTLESTRHAIDRFNKMPEGQTMNWKASQSAVISEFDNAQKYTKKGMKPAYSAYDFTRVHEVNDTSKETITAMIWNIMNDKYGEEKWITNKKTGKKTSKKNMSASMTKTVNQFAYDAYDNVVLRKGFGEGVSAAEVIDEFNNTFPDVNTFTDKAQSKQFSELSTKLSSYQNNGGTTTSLKEDIVNTLGRARDGKIEMSDKDLDILISAYKTLDEAESSNGRVTNRGGSDLSIDSATEEGSTYEDVIASEASYSQDLQEQLIDKEGTRYTSEQAEEIDRVRQMRQNKDLIKTKEDERLMMKYAGKDLPEIETKPADAGNLRSRMEGSTALGKNLTTAERISTLNSALDLMRNRKTSYRDRIKVNEKVWKTYNEVIKPNYEGVVNTINAKLPKGTKKLAIVSLDPPFRNMSDANWLRLMRQYEDGFDHFEVGSKTYTRAEMDKIIKNGIDGRGAATEMDPAKLRKFVEKNKIDLGPTGTQALDNLEAAYKNFADDFLNPNYRRAVNTESMSPKASVVNILSSNLDDAQKPLNFDFEKIGITDAKKGAPIVDNNTFEITDRKGKSHKVEVVAQYGTSSEGTGSATYWLEMEGKDGNPVRFDNEDELARKLGIPKEDVDYAIDDAEIFRPSGEIDERTTDYFGRDKNAPRGIDNVGPDYEEWQLNDFSVRKDRPIAPTKGTNPALDFISSTVDSNITQSSIDIENALYGNDGKAGYIDTMKELEQKKAQAKLALDTNYYNAVEGIVAGLDGMDGDPRMRKTIIDTLEEVKAQFRAENDPELADEIDKLINETIYQLNKKYDSADELVEELIKKNPTYKAMMDNIEEGKNLKRGAGQTIINVNENGPIIVNSDADMAGKISIKQLRESRELVAMNKNGKTILADVGNHRKDKKILKSMRDGFTEGNTKKQLIGEATMNRQNAWIDNLVEAVKKSTGATEIDESKIYVNRTVASLGQSFFGEGTAGWQERAYKIMTALSSWNQAVQGFHLAGGVGQYNAFTLRNALTMMWQDPIGGARAIVTNFRDAKSNTACINFFMNNSDALLKYAIDSGDFSAINKFAPIFTMREEAVGKGYFTTAIESIMDIPSHIAENEHKVAGFFKGLKNVYVEMFDNPTFARWTVIANADLTLRNYNHAAKFVERLVRKYGLTEDDFATMEGGMGSKDRYIATLARLRTEMYWQPQKFVKTGFNAQKYFDVEDAANKKRTIEALRSMPKKTTAADSFRSFFFAMNYKLQMNMHPVHGFGSLVSSVYNVPRMGAQLGGKRSFNLATTRFAGRGNRNEALHLIGLAALAHAWNTYIGAPSAWEQLWSDGENKEGHETGIAKSLLNFQDFFKFWMPNTEDGKFDQNQTGYSLDPAFSIFTLQNSSMRATNALFNPNAAHISPYRNDLGLQNWTIGDWKVGRGLEGAADELIGANLLAGYKATYEVLNNNTYFGNNVWEQPTLPDGRENPNYDPGRNFMASIAHILNLDGALEGNGILGAGTNRWVKGLDIDSITWEHGEQLKTPKSKGLKVGNKGKWQDKTGTISGSGIFQHEYTTALQAINDGDYFEALSGAMELPFKSRNFAARARTALNQEVSLAIRDAKVEYDNACKNASVEEKDKAYAIFAKKAVDIVHKWSKEYGDVLGENDELTATATKILMSFMSDEYDDDLMYMQNMYSHLRQELKMADGDQFLFSKQAMEDAIAAGMDPVEAANTYNKHLTALKEAQMKEYKARLALEEAGINDGLDTSVFDTTDFMYDKMKAEEATVSKQIYTEIKGKLEGQVGDFKNFKDMKAYYEELIKEASTTKQKAKLANKYNAYVEDVISPYIDKYGAAVVNSAYWDGDNVMNHFGEYIIIPADKYYTGKSPKSSFLKDELHIGYRDSTALPSDKQIKEELNKVAKALAKGQRTSAASLVDNALLQLRKGVVHASPEDYQKLIRMRALLSSRRK